MKAHELQRRHRKMLKRMLREKRPSGGRVLTTVRPATEMLTDDRSGDATAQLLAICCASAFGQAERQDCFVCLQPWTTKRRPVDRLRGVRRATGCEAGARVDVRDLLGLLLGSPRGAGPTQARLRGFREFSNTPGTA